MERTNNTPELRPNNMGDIALTPEMVRRVLNAMLVAQDGEPDRLATELAIQSGGLSLIAHDVVYQAIETIADVAPFVEATRAFGREVRGAKVGCIRTSLDVARCEAIARIIEEREFIDDTRDALNEAKGEIEPIDAVAGKRSDVVVLCASSAALAAAQAAYAAHTVEFCSECDEGSDTLCESCGHQLGHEIAVIVGYCAEKVVYAALEHGGEPLAQRYVEALRSAAAGIYASRKAVA